MSDWTLGPAPEGVAELIRSLELTINRRLDGVLHGNHQGITPGHGSEPGESRPYQPGDDVRRIDWNVTARTGETYVRDQVADHDLTAWLVVDASAAMRFGTVRDDKSSTAIAAAACIGFLTARHQNRLGAVIVAGSHVRVLPPRGGRDQVRVIISAIAGARTADGEGRADLSAALHRVGAVARRRGFVAVISDFPGTEWADALGRLGQRHDLLTITVRDPREYDLPEVGWVEFRDPATGDQREYRVTASVREEFARAAREDRGERIDALRRAGAEVIELTTDADWLGTIVQHVQRQRIQAVHGGSIGR